MTAGALRERRGGGEDDGRAWTVDAETRERVDRVRSMGLDRPATAPCRARRAAPRATASPPCRLGERGRDRRVDPAADSDADEEPPRGVRDEAPARPPREASTLTRPGRRPRTIRTIRRDSNDGAARRARAHRPPRTSPPTPTPSATPATRRTPPRTPSPRTPRTPSPRTPTPPPTPTSDPPRLVARRGAASRHPPATRCSPPTRRSSAAPSSSSTPRRWRTFARATICAPSPRSRRCSASRHQLTHASLHVCHSNRSAAYLNLGLHEEALWDARRCLELAEAKWARTRDLMAVAPVFVKGHAGCCDGHGYARAAKQAFEAGLAMDPAHAECKRGSRRR